MADLGVATAAIQFFRSMGASLAVAALGALLTAKLPAGVDPNRLTTSARGRARQRPRSRSRTPRTPSSSRSCPLAAIVLVLSVLLPELPLRTNAPADD